MKFVRVSLAVGAVAVGLGVGGLAKGNAVAVTNLSLLNASNGFAEIHFDLSWSNSWRSTWTDNGGATFVTNWDAVWVHAKQRVSGGTWGPVYFATSNNVVGDPNFSFFIGTNAGVTNVGAMIYRNADGIGGVSLTNITLNWNYAAGGLYGTNQVDVALFAVEMVYIPEGAFYVGDGTANSVNGQLYQYPATNQPFLITNENAITLGATTGSMSFTTGQGGTASGVLSNVFPKGYRAFYSMKYEISQGQYADFLNHISPGQAINRYIGNLGSSRQTVTFTNGAYSAAAPDRAANYLGIPDLCAYLDWAGLRPLTELEFEKMCRGFKAPVVGELAFGDVTPVYASSSFIGTDGSGTETLANASANICGSALSGGPLRCGIFARTNSTRSAAGAGYFGNMELSGSMWESTVTIGNATGRAFLGEHGDGDITVQPASWPSAAGGGLRGGGWADSIPALDTSYRSSADTTATRANVYGGRGGRTGP